MGERSRWVSVEKTCEHVLTEKWKDEGLLVGVECWQVWRQVRGFVSQWRTLSCVINHHTSSTRCCSYISSQTQTRTRLVTLTCDQRYVVRRRLLSSTLHVHVHVSVTFTSLSATTWCCLLIKRATSIRSTGTMAWWPPFDIASDVLGIAVVNDDDHRHLQQIQ